MLAAPPFEPCASTVPPPGTVDPFTVLLLVADVDRRRALERIFTDIGLPLRWTVCADRTEALFASTARPDWLVVVDTLVVAQGGPGWLTSLRRSGGTAAPLLVDVHRPADVRRLREALTSRLVARVPER